MKFESNLPIYVQIVDLIKRQIVTSELKEGDKLPSVRDIATELKVNPNTIQRSYQELERKNLVFTQRGMGTFVTEDENIIDELKNSMAVNIINDFILNMKSIGYKPEDIKELINKKLKEVK